MPSNEAIELIESALGDAINKQKNKIKFSRNLRTAKGLEEERRRAKKGGPYLPLSPDLERKEVRSSMKAYDAANELRRLDPNSSWVINKENEIKDKVKKHYDKLDKKVEDFKRKF